MAGAGSCPLLLLTHQHSLRESRPLCPPRTPASRAVAGRDFPWPPGHASPRRAVASSGCTIGTCSAGCPLPRGPVARAVQATAFSSWTWSRTRPRHPLHDRRACGGVPPQHAEGVNEAFDGAFDPMARALAFYDPDRAWIESDGGASPHACAVIGAGVDAPSRKATRSHRDQLQVPAGIADGHAARDSADMWIADRRPNLSRCRLIVGTGGTGDRAEGSRQSAMLPTSPCAPAFRSFFSLRASDRLLEAWAKSLPSSRRLALRLSLRPRSVCTVGSFSSLVAPASSPSSLISRGVAPRRRLPDRSLTTAG